MEKNIKLKCNYVEFDILNEYSKITSVRYSQLIKTFHCDYREEYPHTHLFEMTVRIPETEKIIEGKTYSFQKYIELTDDTYVQNIISKIRMTTNFSIYPENKRIKTSEKKLKDSVKNISEFFSSQSIPDLKDLKEKCESFLNMYYATYE